MQDRYSGDVGDFAKFGLLRALGERMRVGLQYYLVPDESHNADGRHVDYLRHGEFRACDAALCEALERVVRSGNRIAAALRGAMPAGTRFFESKLTFAGVPARDRERLRRDWVSDGLQALADCELVCADPDNGLEISSARRCDPKGPKFAFYDELAHFLDRGQSLVVYQHVTREKGGASAQAQRRFREIARRLPHGDGAFALRFNRYSARLFFVVPAPAHANRLRQRARAMMLGPWRRCFELLEPSAAPRKQTA
jgi:hypothetical protein